MNKHDPLNGKCLQNCVVNRGARVSCAHLHHDCTCPAQKEDPFSEFMKSQGINVVDVTPTQKEECRNDRNLEMIGVISLFQSKVYDTEQLYKEMEEIFKKDCRSQISLAEARGREEANKCDECGGTDVVCAKGVMDSIRLARTETITAFEEWTKVNKQIPNPNKELSKHALVEVHYYNKALADILSFASFLKSNAPKV